MRWPRLTLSSLRLPVLSALGLFTWLSLAPCSADAFPGVFVGKSEGKRVNLSTHIVMMQKENISVVTVFPDYDGAADGFAVVMPLPADVTADRLKAIKWEFMGRVEEMTAPRAHEFYEQDPCDPGPTEQEWQRDLTVKTAGPIGAEQPVAPKKVAPELLLNLNTVFKDNDGEYKFHVLDPAQSADFESFLSGKGYKISAPMAASLKAYVAKGQRLLVAEVDPARLELVSGGRSQLAGIRYWSEQPVTTLDTTLGLNNLEGKQDLYVYVVHPNQRWETKNYKVLYPPTNIEVLEKIDQNGKERLIKERIGELYNAMQDLMLKKDPKAFLFEFAWSSKGCGQPCPNERLLPNELLTLGGDVFEEKLVPKDQRNPAPPPEAEELKKALTEQWKELKPKERKAAKKQHEDDRKELARRKAMLERQVYTISRLHYRYDKSTLPEDVVLGPASDQIVGGVDLPKGPNHDISMAVTPGEQSQFQVRFNDYFKWDGMMQCDKPQRGRWGKRWAHRRIWNKLWVAQDLSAKSRDEINPAAVVLTPLPALGLTGKVAGAAADADAGADAGTAEPVEVKKSCGCQTVGSPGAASLAPFGFLGLAFLARRRRNRG